MDQKIDAKFPARHLFTIPDSIHYFNVAGVSPLLKSVVSAGEQGLLIKSHPWEMTEEHFFDLTEQARSLFAQLIHSSANSVAIIPSATYGVETALRNLTLKTGDEVLVQEEEFPAIILPLQRLCAQTGAQMRFVQRPSNGNWTQAILEHITEKTRFLGVGHSHWTDGTVADLEVLGEHCQKRNIFYLVDVCQSLGAVPHDIQKIQADFLIAPTYKWLLGPYTYGFLYADPKHHQGQALEEYWASREGARDFSRLTAYEPQHRPGAIRFDMGERSQFINTPMTIAALKQIQDWGVHSIANYLDELTEFIAQASIEMGFRVSEKKFRSPHFLGIRWKNGFSEKFQEYLHQKNIYVGYRGDCMRISPHVFTNQNDAQNLLEGLRQIEKYS
jgi:selenocysteine lyase/cysteine desulfurase